MAKRYRLLAKAFMDGAVREPGYAFTLEEGQLGPHRTVVHGPDVTNLVGDRDNDRTPAAGADEPLYVEIDEGIEKERADLSARHAAEREELDQAAARRELDERHRQEFADLNRREALRQLQLRHERERAAVEARHASEQEGFRTRAEAPPVPIVPVETDAEVLAARHKAELEALEEKHAAEAAAMEEPQPEPAAPDGEGGYPSGAEEPEHAPSIADKDWDTRPEHGASAADPNWPGNPAPVKPGLVGTQARPGSGPPAMNRPFTQSGPGSAPAE